MSNNENLIEKPHRKHHRPKPPFEEPAEVTIPIWEYKEIPDFYNRVRGALSVGNVLTDTIIDYFEHAPMAEMQIKQRIPNWTELTDIKRLLFETCIVYMTCYILCPQYGSNQITKYKDPSLEVDYATNKNSNPCARFAELIEDLIAQINEEEQAPFFCGFQVTPSIPSHCCCHWKMFPHIIIHKTEEDKPCKPDKPHRPHKPHRPKPPVEEEPTEPDIPNTPDTPDTPEGDG